MGENNKVLLGVLGGVLLGAFGAAVVKRGNLRPHAAKVLSYGYDIKDAIIEQAETLKETCEDLAAEDRKAEEQKPAVTPAPTVVPEDSKKE